MTDTSALFSNLSIEDVDTLPGRASTRSAGPNPITPAMKQSAAKRTDQGEGRWQGAPKMVTVEAAQAVQVTNLIRSAATECGFGTVIRLTTLDGQRLEIVSVGGTTKTGSNGKPRISGGKPEVQKNGKAYGGKVKVGFAAKSVKQAKKTAAAPVAQ